MKKFLNYLSSIKLAIILIVCLIPISVIYSKTRSYRFLLLLIISIFFVNLLLCTVKRIIKQVKAIIRVNPGPDIIHTGILLAIVSFALSSIYNYENLVRLSKGEFFEFYGRNIEVLDIDNKKLETLLEIKGKNSSNINEKIKVNVIVNRPYRSDSIAVFQNQIVEMKFITLKSNISGKEYYLLERDHFKIDDKVFIVDNISSNFVTIIESDNNSELKVGDNILNFSIKDINYEVQTVLLFKYEPFYYLTLISLFIVLLGFLITLLKIRRIDVR